jgi:hypothetical protein
VPSSMEDTTVCHSCPTQEATKIITELDAYCCSNNKIYSRTRTDILTIASKLIITLVNSPQRMPS